MSRKNSVPYVVGIDPGTKGGVACVRPEPGSIPTLLFVEDLPYLGGRLDAYALALMLESWGRIGMVVVEKVVAMPSTEGKRTMGAQSMLNYGISYGMILGVASGLDLPLEEVHPSPWKRAMGVTKNKDAARARARETFPNLADRFARKRDDGRAEAALLARWAVTAYGGERAA